MIRLTLFATTGRTLFATLLAIAGLAAATPAGAQTRSTQPTQPDEGSDSPSKMSSGKQSGLLLLGDAAPDFKLRDQSGREVRFHAWRGGGLALLLFVDRVTELDDDFPDLVESMSKQGVRTLAICRNTGDMPAALSDESAAMVLRDRWGDVAGQYGAVDRLSGDAVPAVVVVDNKGKVRYLAAGALPDRALLEGIVYVVRQKGADGSY